MVVPYLFIAPAIAIFLVGLGVPFVQTIYTSFWDWNGLTLATWAGVDNYVEIITSDDLRESFAHALTLILFYSVLPIGLALVLSGVLGRAGSRLPGGGFFRTILFLPQVVATAVVATTWLAIYAPDGLINSVLRTLGLGDLARAWLGDFTTALPAIGLVGTWANLGLCLVLFLVGYATVPGELFEAARLDGAGPVREFFSIALPLLRPQIAVAATLTAVSALKTFDLVYITTLGGPGTSTTVPAFEVFNRAIRTNEVGLASAIAVVLTGAVLLLTLAVSRIQPKEQA